MLQFCQHFCKKKSTQFAQDTDNAMLAPLMLELAKVAQKSRSQVNTALEGLGAAWLSELVKEVAPVAGTSTTTDYASYQGSLTRPGCQEGVDWIIFLTPLKISSTQMEVFRSASG